MTYASGRGSPSQYSKKKNLTVRGTTLLARTGDIVLLSGGSFDSQCIEVGTNGLWSHVLVVVMMDNGKGKYEPAAFESVYSSDFEKDKWGRTVTKGVRVVWLEPYLENYKGFTAAYRALTVADEKYYDEFQKYINDIMGNPDHGCVNRYLGRPYETKWMEFLRVWLGGCLPGRKTPTSDQFFCSELVATCLQDAKLLTTEIAANEYSPEAFSGASSLTLKSPHIRFGPRISYGDELYIRLPNAYEPEAWWSLFARHLCK